jgi:hypothetical protein
VFFLIETMASSGIDEAPLIITGVTETSCHAIGTLAVVKIFLIDSLISGPIPTRFELSKLKKGKG